MVQSNSMNNSEKPDYRPSIRKDTNTMYFSEFLTEKLVPAYVSGGLETDAHRESLIRVINVIDREAEIVFGNFGTALDATKRDTFIEKVVKIQHLLQNRLARIEDRLDDLGHGSRVFDPNKQEDADDLSYLVSEPLDRTVQTLDSTDGLSETQLIEKEVSFLTAEAYEIADILGFAETAVNFAPTETDLFYHDLLINVRKYFEPNSGQMATPDQFREFLYDKINNAMQFETFGTLRASQMSFPIIAENKTLLEMYLFFRDKEHDPHFPGYAEQFNPIWAYVGWRLGSRIQEAALWGKYHHTEGLVDDLMKENLPIEDANGVDIIRGGLENARDSFSVPAPERARAAVLLYENIHVITLIASQNNPVKLGFPEGTTPTAGQIFQKKVDLLRNQETLGFLTEAEAAFLLDNIVNFMAWEETPKDTLTKTRVAIGIFCAGDAIRSDQKKRDAVLNGQADTQKYNDFLQSGLKIDVQNSKITITKQGRPLTEDEQKLADEMLKYGERMEGGAYSMLWPTMQFAQADTGARGFSKETVRDSQTRLYSERYLMSDYPSGPDWAMAKAMPRRLKTWYSQMRVRRNGKKYDESLITIMGDENFDFSREFHPREQVNMGESVRLADNLKRSFDTAKLMEQGLFGEDFLGDFASFDRADAKTNEAVYQKLGKAMNKVYKILKYQVDMFVPVATEKEWAEIITDSHALSNILGEVSIMKNPATSDKDRKESQKRIARYYVESMFLSLMSSSITRYYREHYNPLIAGQAPSEVIRQAKIKNVASTGTADVGDFMVLHRLWTASGLARTSAKAVSVTDPDTKRVKTEIIGKKVFSLERNYQSWLNEQRMKNTDLINSQEFWENDPLANAYLDAVLESTVPELIAERDQKTAFDFYVKVN